MERNRIAGRLRFWFFGGRMIILSAVMAGLALPTGSLAKGGEEPKLKPTPRGNPGEWVTDNDYPVSESVSGIEGITGFALTVSADGRVSDCQVTTGSGSEALDETTCLLMRQRARFNPALDKKNRPIEASWRSRVVWRLPELSRQLVKDYPKRLRVAIDVDEEGVVEDCRILENVGNATFTEKLNQIIDPCEAARRNRKLFPVWNAQGEPTKAHIEMLTETRITPR